MNEEEIISSYLNGTKIKDIANKYGVSYVTVKNRLVKNNIEIRTKKEVKELEFKEYSPDRCGRKYYFNHEYFQTWSSACKNI